MRDCDTYDETELKTSIANFGPQTGTLERFPDYTHACLLLFFS